MAALTHTRECPNTEARANDLYTARPRARGDTAARARRARRRVVRGAWRGRDLLAQSLASAKGRPYSAPVVREGGGGEGAADISPWSSGVPYGARTRPGRPSPATRQPARSKRGHSFGGGNLSASPPGRRKMSFLDMRAEETFLG